MRVNVVDWGDLFKNLMLLVCLWVHFLIASHEMVESGVHSWILALTDARSTCLLSVLRHRAGENKV